MPKSARSCVFFPRQKGGEDDGESGPVTRYISVNYEMLEDLFHLPLKGAAHEVGLCPTTFKKACRRFDIEKWPYRKGQSRVPHARRNVQPDGGVDVTIKTQLEEGLFSPAARETLQTTEVHQGKRAVTVSCTDPALFLPFSAVSSSSSTVRASSELRRECLDPVGGAFSSAAAADLLQQASMDLDTMSCEARHAGAASQPKTFAPLNTSSYVDSSAGSRIFIGVPRPEGLSTLPFGEQSDAMPLGVGPPRRERSFVEAVFEYLDGPLTGNFDFMFADEP